MNTIRATINSQDLASADSYRTNYSVHPTPATLTHRIAPAFTIGP